MGASITNPRGKGSINIEELHLLADRVFNPLSVRAQALAFLPAHLHQHLIPDVFHGQFELFVFRVIWLPSFLQREGINSEWVIFYTHLILVSQRRGKNTFSDTKLGWFWQAINN